MKRFFVLFLLAISIANFSFGQSSYENSQITNTSKQISRMNHLANPDLIFPKQVLLLPIPGLSYPIYYDVDPGDCLWYISKRINMGEFSPNIQPELVKSIVEEKQKAAMDILLFPDWLNWLALILLLLALVWALYLIIRDGRRWRNSDPVTSGPAQIPGGIEDRDVAAVMASRHPNCRILSITKGRLYGRGVAHYNFNRLSMNAILNDMFGKNFNGEVGYQARIINPAGQEMLVQTLMGCGNEIRMNGKFMTGLDFIPDEEQPTVLPQQPAAEVIPAISVPKEEPVREEIKNSEAHLQRMKALDILEGVLTDNEVHELNLEIGTDGGMKMGIKYKFVQDSKKQKTEEKKG